MTRIQSIIERLESGTPIDWRREELLLALDMLRQSEQFVETLIQRDTQADDHFAQPANRSEYAR